VSRFITKHISPEFNNLDSVGGVFILTDCWHNFPLVEGCILALRTFESSLGSTRMGAAVVRIIGIRKTE